jgi:N utilization substance protein A
VGWRIDIKSEEEKRQEVEAEMARMQRVVEELRSLPEVGDKISQKLIDAGVAGIDHILQMTDEDICSIEGIGPKTAEKIRESATIAKVEWDRRDAEEAARYEQAQAEADAQAEAYAQANAEAQSDEAAADATAADETTAEAAGTEAAAETASEEVAAQASGPGEGGEADDER